MKNLKKKRTLGDIEHDMLGKRFFYGYDPKMPVEDFFKNLGYPELAKAYALVEENCTCSYSELVKFVDKEGVVHNKNCNEHEL